MRARERESERNDGAQFHLLQPAPSRTAFMAAIDVRSSRRCAQLGDMRSKAWRRSLTKFPPTFNHFSAPLVTASTIACFIQSKRRKTNRFQFLYRVSCDTRAKTEAREASYRPRADERLHFSRRPMIRCCVCQFRSSLLAGNDFGSKHCPLERQKNTTIAQKPTDTTEKKIVISKWMIVKNHTHRKLFPFSLFSFPFSIPSRNISSLSACFLFVIICVNSPPKEEQTSKPKPNKMDSRNFVQLRLIHCLLHSRLRTRDGAK